jgi:three-Cys-motif partner protein
MKESQITMLEHSEIKIKLLGEYIKKYLSIISNDRFTKKIKIYDLFCGEGIYENGGEGSPIIFLKAVKDLFFTNKARNLPTLPIDLHFNDLDTQKVEKLRDTISEKKLHYQDFGDLKFTSIDYEKAIPMLQERFSSSMSEKGFIFIDPYGYGNIKASDIKNLLQSKKTEVLLFLPTQFMYRFDSNGTPQALKDFISELVDYEEWKKTKSIIEFIVQLTNNFRSFMGDEYFVDTFTIQKDLQTVYCLFFFSSHIKGFEKMLEAKWAIDEQEGRGWKFDESKMVNLFEMQKTNPLEDKLLKFMQQKVVNSAEIYEFTLRNGFLPKHTVSIFRNWQNTNKLYVDKASKKGAFYINYETYKNDPNRVSFRIN